MNLDFRKTLVPDADPLETREWLDSIDAVMQHGGHERAHHLLRQIHEHLQVDGVRLPYLVHSPYINTIPAADQPIYPGDLAMEKRIRRIVRWNAAVMVHRANQHHPGLGGHLATYASAATMYEVGFHHFFRSPEHPDGGDQVFFQGHSAPGVYAHAFLAGRLSDAQLDGFRREAGTNPGMSSYPHPRLMPDFWQFSTVSMGLGPICAVYQARFNRYLQHRGIADTSNSLIRRFGTGIKTCDDFDGCTIDACDGNSGACTHAQVANCCQPIKQWWKFEQVPEIEGWTLAACKASTSYYNPTSCVDYSATTPFKGWQIWTTSIAKGKSEGALYYGDPQAKNFNFGATAGTATSPKWSVPGPGAKLEFSFYFDCETSTTYDKFYVYLLVNDVKTNVGIASLPTNGAIVYKGQANYSLTKKFHDVSLDVSAYAGKQVQLQFYFNTGDSIGNSGQGIFVDDIRFSSPCN